MPDATEWPNVLLLCNLLFSLPVSNGRVKSIFSATNVIKTERRATMHSNTLSDLKEIHTEGTPMSDFLPDDAIHVWWTSCRTSRRVNQTPRKAYKPLNLYLQVQPLPRLHFQHMVIFHLRVAVAVMKLMIITVLLLWMSGTSGLWMIDFQV